MTLQNTALGTYTFPFNPHVNTPHKPRTVFETDAGSSAVIDDFKFVAPESGLIGVELELSWDIMAQAFYNSLRGYYESDDPADLVTFDPKERAHTPSAKYKVRIPYFEPEEGYHRLALYLHRVVMRMNIRQVV